MLIQDLGRGKAQHIGFSDCGAVDEYSHRWANKLLDNSITAATIELTLGQGSFVANTECLIAITGADCLASVNGKSINNWSTHRLMPNDQLSFAVPLHGLRSYLAVQGGFNSELFHGSQSCNTQEGIGGLNGKALAKGESVPFPKQHFIKPLLQRFVSPVYQNETINNSEEVCQLNFIVADQFALMSERSIDDFCQQIYQVSITSNRMGYRLNGEPFILKNKTRISKPTCYGNIQIPPDGQPIVLLKDRQTIGGYPVAGTVIKRDLYKLAQLKPHQNIQFNAVSLENALLDYRAFTQFF